MRRGGAHADANSARVAQAAVHAHRARTAPQPATVPVSDVDFAVNLHRLVVANLPMRTDVDAIPQKYEMMFRLPFPIPPMPIGPTGLAALLTRDFRHILIFTHNRSGQVFVEPALSPEIPLDEVARIHVATRSAAGPVPQPMPSAGAPSMTTGQKLSPDEERSAQLILKALHKVIVMNPALGEADSLEKLRDNILDAFYDMFGTPMVLSSGLPVDPIELIRKNEKRVFTKLIQEPVTGRVTVRAIVEGPSFIPQVTLTAPPGGKTGGGSAEGFRTVNEAMVKLRSHLVANLGLIDVALARGDRMAIPDPALWKQALETLIGQEVQSTGILTNLFNH